MKPSDFDYDLPESAIAQEPCSARDDSRLMVLRAGDAEPEHRTFRDLPELLRTGDLVVLNDTRVLAARLAARKASGGRVEILLLETETGRPDVWRCLLRASRKPGPGDRLAVTAGLDVVVLERHSDAFVVRLEAEDGNPGAILERVGAMPLPPYIRRVPDDPRKGKDRERYQTVYARVPGAVAAPTAGLHFTPALLEGVRRRGVRTASITLHVGAGTFLPVRTARIEDHVMHAERFDLPPATAHEVRDARERGGRVVAVGTTVARTLEHRALDDGSVEPGRGRCSLFIHPGFRFRVVDVLITNFHLPRSTLLMLVSAFAGRERILAAYRSAVEGGYRFYSYGDSMLVERAAA